MSKVKLPHALISAKSAAALRDLVIATKGKVEFVCPTCRKPVSPHGKGKSKGGVESPAHFEHFDRDENECPLSHVARP